MKTRTGGLGLLVAATAALLLSACKSAPPPPRVVLKPCEIALTGNPKVAEKGLTGATLLFTFRITNPNAGAVTLERMHLDGKINDKDLGTNEASPSATIGPNETKDVDVRYDVSYVSAGAGVLDALASQDAKVMVDGTAAISNANPEVVADLLEYPFQIK
jgi:LEA14-like dessication related protein